MDNDLNGQPPTAPASPTTPPAPATPPAAPTASPPAPSPAAPATQLPADPPPAPAADAAPATFGEAVTYEASGDANLDLALAFFGKHGLGPEHPAVEAAGKGDFGPVKALLAEKGVQGWEAYTALAEQGYQNLAAQTLAREQAVQQIVVQAAGDEATWAQTLAWASTNAEPDEKEAVNTALAQGGVVAEAMAAFLVSQYRSATGTTYTPSASATKPDAGRGASNPTGGPLSPAEYGKAVMELRRTMGGRFEDSGEYRQLQTRRAMWRGT